MNLRFRLGFATAVCLLLVSILGAQTTGDGTMGIGGEGVHFPDGSVQTTAAVTPEAYPQQCGPLLLDQSESDFFSCANRSSEDPEWSDFNGVPNGYFFLVTDIVVSPFTAFEVGGISIDIRLETDCDNNAPGGGGFADFRRVKIGENLRTWSGSFESPTLMLTPGDCLEAKAGNANDYKAQVVVSGYLTTDPNHLSR